MKWKDLNKKNKEIIMLNKKNKIKFNFLLDSPKEIKLK